jgi:putative transcriptional regulator
MDNGIFYLKDYGKVTITLKEIMNRKGMTRNKLASLTGLVFNTINRYYQPAPITSVDLDILAKICFILGCEIGDLLKYEKPSQHPY